MNSESPMKKNVTIKDSDLAEGIRQHLARAEVSFGDYVSQLIGQDIISRLQYRLIGFYDDGSTHVETEFYTALDFSRSVKAYKAVMCDPYLSTLGSGTKLIGYAAYKENHLLSRDGVTIRSCRVCGCTDDRACPGSCYWVEDDLCSNCTAAEQGDNDAD